MTFSIAALIASNALDGTRAISRPAKSLLASLALSPSMAPRSPQTPVYARLKARVAALGYEDFEA